MHNITNELPYSPHKVLEEFTQQVSHWRLDKLLHQLFAGEQQAKCQFGWYLQYFVTPQEIENFTHTFTALEQAKPNSPYIPLVKMVQYLYGLGVTPSLEHSRLYLQQFQECYALTATDPHDEFLQTLIQVNQMPHHLRCQWLASKGNGEAICDLAKHYLTEAQEPTAAIDLLLAASRFGYYRALKELASLYRDGEYIAADENKANHFSRKAFLRKINLQPDQFWQIKDLPIAGYSERLAERSTERTYHEVMCLLHPEYDFLFDKNSTLVPLVHNPSITGVLENIKTIPAYFIEQLINFDISELKSVRLQEALEKLVAEYDLPKPQRDQVHLLLAYQYARDNKSLAAARHTLAVKQPHLYTAVIRHIDSPGRLGECLLVFAETPEAHTLPEAEALVEYALIYLIACLDNLSDCVRQLLKNQLLERFPQYTVNHTILTADDLQQLANWHMQYSQARYALYKIQHRLQNYSRWKWYLSRKQRHRYQNARTAWKKILQQLNANQELDNHLLNEIKIAYPILTNSLEQLASAPASVLKRLQPITYVLLAQSNTI
jgi:hypothetical protein